MSKAPLVLALLTLPAAAAAQQAAAAPIQWPVQTTSWDGPLVVERVAEGLERPSSMAFLPDGRALVTDRTAGRILLLDPASGELTTVEQVTPRFEGEGGIGVHDVVLHPDFARDPWIYFSYTAEAPGGTTLALDRARLRNGRLEDRERLFLGLPAYETTDHYGGRIVVEDGYLFVTSGDRQVRDSAQSLGTHNGKVLRLLEDGRVPDDNPFVGVTGALPEIWSYGHRNPQGLLRDPTTGVLWVHEHGPRGGDELNIVRPGANYGWPRVSYGREYEGGLMGDGRVRYPGMQEPAWLWRPSIAPSGLERYDGQAFPRWRGALLVGAMGRRHLNVLTLDGDRVIHEERVLTDQRWRVRFVSQGPDGFVYLGVDDGLILRLRPGG